MRLAKKNTVKLIAFISCFAIIICMIPYLFMRAYAYNYDCKQVTSQEDLDRYLAKMSANDFVYLTLNEDFYGDINFSSSGNANGNGVFLFLNGHHFEGSISIESLKKKNVIIKIFGGESESKIGNGTAVINDLYVGLHRGAFFYALMSSDVTLKKQITPKVLNVGKSTRLTIMDGQYSQCNFDGGGKLIAHNSKIEELNGVAGWTILYGGAYKTNGSNVAAAPGYELKIESDGWIHSVYSNVPVHTHLFEKTWTADEKNGHYHKCLNSGCPYTIESYKLITEAAYSSHIWTEGKCTICEYICDHNGQTEGICRICGMSLNKSDGPRMYNVQVTNGATVSQNIVSIKSEKYYVATVKIKEANGVNESKEWFVYWKDKNTDEIISTYSTYSFFAVKDITLTPVYVDSSEYETERKKAVITSRITKCEMKSNDTCLLLSEYSVSKIAMPEVVGHGILYTLDEKCSNDLIYGNTDIENHAARKTNTQHTGTLETIIPLEKANDIWARSYIIDGNGEVYYGAIKQFTADETVSDDSLEKMDACITTEMFLLQKEELVVKPIANNPISADIEWRNLLIAFLNLLVERIKHFLFI